MTHNKNNNEKERMRDGVFTLLKYWKNITKPTYYNVVSLPGESFEFELKALELEKEGEYMTLHMYEKLEKVYNEQQSVVEKNDLLNQEGVFYKNESLPPVSAFAYAPTFAWADLCGNPTQRMLNFSAMRWLKSRSLSLPSLIVFVVPMGLTGTFWLLVL